VNPDFVFIVSYQCPRCHAALEARASGPPEWLRCPECGRAGMPPEHNRGPRPPIDADTLVIGTFTTPPAELPIRPRAMAPRPSGVVPRNPTARVVLGSGFFLSTFLFIFSMLDSKAVNATLFGVTAATSLFLLARPVSPGRRA